MKRAGSWGSLARGAAVILVVASSAAACSKDPADTEGSSGMPAQVSGSGSVSDLRISPLLTSQTPLERDRDFIVKAFVNCDIAEWLVHIDADVPKSKLRPLAAQLRNMLAKPCGELVLVVDDAIGGLAERPTMSEAQKATIQKLHRASAEDRLQAYKQLDFGISLYEAYLGEPGGSEALRDYASRSAQLLAQMNESVERTTL